MESKESMKLTKKEVSKYIPHDISFDILSKLPLKSLKRFTCVCKFWTNLFEKPQFMRMYHKHLSRSTYDDLNSRLLFKQTPEFYTSDEDNLYILSNETFENSIKLDWPPPTFESFQADMFVFGSVVNGILCVYQGFGSASATTFEREVVLVLWSPSTDEFKVIPSGSIEHLILKAFPPGTVLEELPIIPTFVGIHGFGYDPVTDDYKLIRRSGFSRDLQSYEIESFWQIYSLKSNCWRDLQVQLEMPGTMVKTVDFPVNLRGMCHWLGNDGSIAGDNELVSFNLSDETFIRTPLIHADDGSFVEYLVVLKESIALMESGNCGGYLISILGELGVAESLTRLFRIGLLPEIHEIIGFGKNGNIFYVTRDKEIAKYNLNTEMIEEIGVKGRYGSCQMVIYNESLLPIEGILS